MRKSFSLEITIITLLLAAAFTYQVMRKKAEENNLVPDKVPTLPRQQLVKAPVIESDSVLIPKFDRQEVIRKFIGNTVIPVPERYDENLSLLGVYPTWASLDVFQETITKKDFEKLLTEVYTVGNAWKKWIKIEDGKALIQMSNKQKENENGELEVSHYELRFAEKSAQRMMRYWRPAHQMPVAPEGKELSLIHI